MKICAISPFSSASSKNILSVIEEMSDASLVVLPGISENTPSAKQVQKVLSKRSRVFLELMGNAELSATPALISRDKIRALPKQVFAQNPSTQDIDNLVSIFPERTISIGSKKFTFIICGEINGFSPDGNLKFGRPLNFDFLVNPCHTIMGHWNHLGKKLSNLSNGKAAIYTTNNNKDGCKITTDVRIYKNRTDISRENKHQRNNVSWVVTEI